MRGSGYEVVRRGSRSSSKEESQASRSCRDYVHTSLQKMWYFRPFDVKNYDFFIILFWHIVKKTLPFSFTGSKIQRVYASVNYSKIECETDRVYQE